MQPQLRGAEHDRSAHATSSRTNPLASTTARTAGSSRMGVDHREQSLLLRVQRGAAALDRHERVDAFGMVQGSEVLDRPAAYHLLILIERWANCNDNPLIFQ